MSKASKILIFLVLIVAVFGGLQACKKHEEPSSALPAAEILDLNGKKVSLSTYAGKPVIVNFWATWCGPCRMEIPMLNELNRKYSSHGLVILGISTDDDGASAVKDFNKEIPIQYLSYLSTPDVETKFGQIWALPTSFFYDRSGKLIDKPLVGVQSREFWEQRIQQMLKQ